MSSNSDYLDGIPTTPNTVSDSWQPAVEQIDTTKKGFNAVSLSAWDTTGTKPTVLAGSEIEAAGGVVRVSTAETILDDTGGIANGSVFLVVAFSGANPEWYFTNDVPVWNADLNGYYDAATGSVSWRYTGHRCYRESSTAFRGKMAFPNIDLVSLIYTYVSGYPITANMFVTSGTAYILNLSTDSVTSRVTGTTKTLSKEFTARISGSIRLAFKLSTTTGDTSTVYIDRNGTQIFTQTTALGVDTDITTDIRMEPGDLIEFYINGSDSSAVSDLRFGGVGGSYVAYTDEVAPDALAAMNDVMEHYHIL